MGMDTRIQGSTSTDLHGSSRLVTKSFDPEPRVNADRTFSSLLTNTIGETIANALGRDVLGILTSKGLLDDVSNTKEFHTKLQSIFGNTATVLERMVVKALDRNLGIRYDWQADFDYGKSLEAAREVCFVESRVK